MKVPGEDDSSAMLKLGGKLFFPAAFLLISLSILYIFPFSSIPLSEFELKLLDDKFLQRGEPAKPDSSNIIILEISQDTYDQIIPPNNRWPWQRSYYAKVINNLMDVGVKAVGIDLLMADPDQYSGKNDSLLIAAIANSEKVVLAGQIDIPRERIFFENNSDDVESQTKNFESLVRKRSENFSNIFFPYDSSLGIVNVPSDRDGVCRRYMPFIYSELTGKKIPSFGFAVLNKYLSLPSMQVAQDSDDSFIVADFKIPKYNASSGLMNFYCSRNCFRKIKFIDVLDDSSFVTRDEADLNVSVNTWDNNEYGLKYSGLFKDKIVLIGSTMPEDKDIVPIPSLDKNSVGGNFIYGVEFHALAISNVLNRSFIKKLSPGFELTIVILLFLFFFYLPILIRNISFVKRIFSEIIILVILILFVYLLYLLSHWLFVNSNYYLPVINSAVAVSAGYVSNIIYSYLESRRQNIFIRKSFSRYVDGEIVKEIIKNPDALKLGGERREITVLFADMKNFAKIAEGKSPSDLVIFLNRFFSDLSGIITNNKGMIDKFIGDAVMAVWSAPIVIENHAYLACKSAIEMREKINSSVYEFGNSEKQQASIRIGINTGDAIVGNFGSDKRFDYTAMGDSVNIASRLEELNKEYGTAILINESTYLRVKDDFEVREVGLVTMRGRTESTNIYELIGMKNSES